MDAMYNGKESENLIISELRIDEDLPKDEYFSYIPAIRSIKKHGLGFTSSVTFLVGENGSGKSTILEAIAISLGFNPEGGTKNYLFSTNDSHSSLHKLITLAKRRHVKNGYFLRAESFYNVASAEERYSGFLSQRYHDRSHGEAFLALAKGFSANGLYILDEPEAALSPTRLMSLMCIIKELEPTSQFIISTHSPILMSYPGARIIELSEKGINETDYRSTEHYRVTKQFIDNADNMFRILFEKD